MSIFIMANEPDWVVRRKSNVRMRRQNEAAGRPTLRVGEGEQKTR